jgi:hypothetical protein
MMNELRMMNEAIGIMWSVNDNDNDNALSCSVERTGWGTVPPFAQAGGVCVYIESAPHPDWLNKAPHPKTGNKALK